MKLRYALRRKYRPDQPRVPAGNPDGGQWTSEAGSDADGTVDVDVTGSTEEQPSRRIDLTEEEARGGHTISGHVAKSESYLLRELRERQLAANTKGDRGDGLRVGSFTSVEAANRFVNSTLAQDPGAVEKVTRGGHLFTTAKAQYDFVTGYEAYGRTERSEPYIREAYGVKVVIFRDPLSRNGFRIRSAFPANFD